MGWDVLLEERLALDPVGEPLHRQWPLPEVGQHHRGDAHVVVDELTLGEAIGGKEHLLEIRYGELPSPNVVRVEAAITGRSQSFHHDLVR